MRAALWCLCLAIILLIFLISLAPVLAEIEYQVMTREDFDLWPEMPEYTIFNYFPSKGTNCTWYVHGRMMQLGYCKYALDSMRYNARSWADSAARGSKLVDQPLLHTIAVWDGSTSFSGSLGHVAVVEKVEKDGSILVSDSSSSGGAYNTYLIEPGDRKWPTAFISVPKGRPKSNRFKPGEKVITTGEGLNFRPNGVNQPSIPLPKGTVADIQENASNGLYASQPGSMSSYHYWWYAVVMINGEDSYGWLAETYLEPAGKGRVLPEPEKKEEPEPEPVPKSEEDHYPPPAPEARHEDESESALEPELIPEIVPEQYPAIKSGDLNHDGKVDVLDITLAMQYILELTTLDDKSFLAADINKDGLVNILDVILITRYILDLNHSLDM